MLSVGRDIGIGMEAFRPKKGFGIKQNGNGDWKVCGCLLISFPKLYAIMDFELMVQRLHTALNVFY